VSQVVKHLPSIYEALSLNPSTAKKNVKKNIFFELLCFLPDLTL
jgi:hypothetical protein